MVSLVSTYNTRTKKIKYIENENTLAYLLGWLISNLLLFFGMLEAFSL